MKPTILWFGTDTVFSHFWCLDRAVPSSENGALYASPNHPGSTLDLRLLCAARSGLWVVLGMDVLVLFTAVFLYCCVLP